MWRVSGRIHLDDLFFSRRPYSPLDSYRQSKLANVLFSRELALRIRGATSFLSLTLASSTIPLSFLAPLTRIFAPNRLRFWRVFILRPPRNNPDRAVSPRRGLVPSAGGVSEAAWSAADEEPLAGGSDHRVLCCDPRAGGPVRIILQVGGARLGQNANKTTTI